jgi:predicted PurR-regulated permease PerM
MARPVELRGKGSRFILLATVFLVVTGLYFGKEVLIPIALAVLLSFLLTPAVRWLETIRLPRVAATLIVVLIGVAAVGSVGVLVYKQFISVLEQLPSYEGELHTKFQSLKGHGGWFRKAEQEIKSIGATSQPAITQSTQPSVATALPDPAKPPAAPIAGQVPTNENPLPVRFVPPTESPLTMIKDYASTVLDPLFTGFLVLILVIFMLLTREDLRDRIIRLVGHGRLNLTTTALDDAGTRISRYLGALSIVNALYGATVAGGLWAIGRLLGHGHGFPNVLVWGLLVGLLRFVPYVGIWIGASVPMLLAFALFPGNAVFFAVVCLFLALEIIVSQAVEPYWYGASTGMSALAVLISAVFWTWLWGPIGLLLSTPLTVCLVVMGKYIPQLEFLEILLGDEPVLPPHVRIYQRLIADDEDEATDLARELLEKQRLETVYDEALLHVLVMAEHDRARDRLDEQKLAAIQQGIRNMVEELAEEDRARRVRKAAADTEDVAKDQPQTEQPGERPEPLHRPNLPKDCTINVLCLPAKGKSDEIVALMLSQLLELRGYCATAGSQDSLASEMVETIEKERTEIVCVSAMPPSAIAHSRYLCKRIHARFPDIHMLVGVWMSKADPAQMKRRIACDESVHLVTTLSQAQDEIDQITHRVNVESQPAPETPKST